MLEMKSIVLTPVDQLIGVLDCHPLKKHSFYCMCTLDLLSIYLHKHTGSVPLSPFPLLFSTPSPDTSLVSQY